MKIFVIALCTVFFIQQVQPKKLKICLKTQAVDVETADISFDKLFEGLKNESDVINIPGTFSSKIQLDGVIKGNLSISDISLSGYKNISTAIFPELLTPFRISLNAITIQGKNYKISSEIADLFDLYGDGKFQMYLEKVSFSVVDLFPALPLGCFTVNLKMQLHKMTANFENLLDGDSVVNEAINHVIGDLVPDIIDYYWPDIYNSIEPWLQEVIDKYMNTQELVNLLTLLMKDRNSIPTKYTNKEFSVSLSSK